MSSAFAPGSRVLIRDEEWLVRRVDPSSAGGYQLTCDGVSELVRGRTSIFLSCLEGSIEVLDPAKTELVSDLSPKFNATLLYLEALRRRTTPDDDNIHLGHRAVMNVLPFQLDPALQALKQPRTRILIADSVGLGKTLEAGILTSELIQRGRGKRILVVTQKSMLTQFQKEFWSRFSIPLVRLDSLGLQRVRNRIPANHNPFNYYDRSIISMDTLKTNLEYRNYLEKAWWDVIIIDECHNVAARAGEGGMSRRARLARLLATRSDSLILLSATPHDGSARSFASLMSLLDPTAISDPDDYTAEDFRNKGLVIRRFKKDIQAQVSADFQERRTTCLRQSASAREDAAFRDLLAIPFTQSGEHHPGKPQALQRIGMQKGMFSSPMAVLDSTRRRIALLQAKADISADEHNEIEALEVFAGSLERIDASSFSKYQKLLSHLNGAEFGWNKHSAEDRVVIFSERIETLNWLNTALAGDLKLKPEQIQILHGGMSDTEQQSIVERFGRFDDKMRILLCSDVASEGLNLHYFCHRLVHFDLPWSLMVFQQRNGRVDRYGQKHQPEIVYLFTETDVDKIQGDLRILEVLQTKDEQVNKNLGDPATYFGVHDAEKEADKVVDFMVQGRSAEAVSQELEHNLEPTEQNEADFLLALFGGVDDMPAVSSLDQIKQPLSLFSSDWHFAKAAMSQLDASAEQIQWSADAASQTLTLTAPRDLQIRLQQLPREAQRERYTLCADPLRMVQSIEQARQARAEDDTWPTMDYLWPQHPIIEWLGDRVLTTFGRHKAPVISSPHLAVGEQALIMLSLIPNRKSQPVLVEWQVAVQKPGESWRLEPFEAFIARAQISAEGLPNSGQPRDSQSLQAGLPQAVQLMRQHMCQRQQQFQTDMQARLATTLAELARLQGRQVEQLELALQQSQQDERLKQNRREKRVQDIHRVFDEYTQWVKDTLTTEPEPYIQVLAAVIR
ncbi:MAG: DEAD/DEAH box helicase [Gammaproteobacteria bacterium]|nr:DEAD/DEAH box helicase [Gammaproteobacteria bacterium]MBU2154717.1 DEAD/DEAH box helicase [Gammaproteobacteria bacterium]MBU2257227.1 DEAD/DEAH box helicase [Gammaproteobacteria bacterium]MBU2293273.1 DEAD/DEAH box helicase [Gammaproteobacteria bacterium]